MKILRDSVFYVLSTGISKGLPFLLLPVLTRFLSVEEFGILGVATVLVGVLAIVVGFNPSLFVIARFYQTARNVLGQYIFNILLISIACCGAIAIIGSFLFSEKLADYGISQMMFMVILLVSLGRVFVSLGQAVLQMEKRAVEYLGISLLFAIPMFALIYTWIVVYGQGWEAVLVSELLVVTAIAVVVILFLLRSNYLTRGFRLNLAKEFLHFSLPLLPHALALWVISFIDRLFLAEMTDIKTVGLYSTAYMLGLGMSLLHESIQRAWQPYFFEYLALNRPELDRRIVKYTWLYYLGTLILFFFYVEALRLLLPILVGEDYLPAMVYVPLVVLGYSVLGMYRVVAGYLHFHGRTISLAMATVFSAVVNIVMNFVLIPINGALGAAQATLIAFIVLFLTVKIIVITSFDMPWISAFRIGRNA